LTVARRPASVIRTRVTCIGFFPAIIRSLDAVASPARTNDANCRLVNPCATIGCKKIGGRQQHFGAK